MRFSFQVLLVGAAVLGGAMVFLGIWTTKQISSSMLKTAAVSSATFIDIFLEPSVQDLPADGALSPESIERLDRMLVDTPLGDRLLSAKIWRTDGTIIYSTQGDLLGQNFASPDVAKAAMGEVIANYDHLSSSDEGFERASGLPLVEIYAPLYRLGTNEVIAVGEYYERASWFRGELERDQTITWLVVAGTTATMVGILLLIALRGSNAISLQRKQLRRRISQASMMASQNRHLRIVADHARLAANEANEQLLARIGSDLHDGPIQLASLLILKLSATDPAPSETPNIQPGVTTEPHRSVDIARDLLAELRSLSAGLSLPEIESLSLDEALRLSIFRHEDMTGAKVTTDFGDLPARVSPALKICAYRIVQEALSNAHKHAGNVPTAVRASVSSETLLISVTDDGPGLGVEDKAVGGRQKLGITGIRNRVSTLRGRVEIGSVEGTGTRISVMLPLEF